MCPNDRGTPKKETATWLFVDFKNHGFASFGRKRRTKRDMNNEQGKVREIDVWRIIKVIWHRLWAVILVAAMGGAIAFAYATYSIKPKYQASTLMYVNNNALSVSGQRFTISASNLSAAQGLVNTYVVILNTRKTLTAVLEKSGLQNKYSYSQIRSMIHAESVDNTEIFQVTVTSTNAEEAARIANTIAAVLPEKIGDVMDGNLAKVVDYAVVNNGKVSPNTNRYVIIGIVLGAVACAVLLVIIDYFDDVIRSEEELKQVMDVPSLAAIPDLLDPSHANTGYYHKGSSQNPANNPKGGARA